MDDFSQVWNIDYNNGKESLFEIQASDDTQYSLGERYSVLVGSRDDAGWSWGLPTSNLEKAFEDAGDEIRLRYTILHDGQMFLATQPGMKTTHTLFLPASISLAVAT